MYDETSLRDKFLIGVVAVLLVIIFVQHCKYKKDYQNLESKIQTIECVKQCLQDLK
jgi:hypothetical protein